MNRFPHPHLSRRTSFHQDYPSSPDGRSSRAEASPWDEAEEDDLSLLQGESVSVRRMRSQVQRIAPYFRTGLIRGEAGVGKQFVARGLHRLSPAAEGPFVVSNATAIAEALARESLSLEPLPAAALLAGANSGTLYLDAVGEVPYPLQQELLRLLRVCDERRPGACAHTSESSRQDVRVLAATHRDLRTLAAVGQFRQDLYARLSVVEIIVPPLRQRLDDLSTLAAWLLRRLGRRIGQSPKVLADGTVAQLTNRQWTNNLRELERVITQASILAEGQTIEPSHLLSLVGPGMAKSPASPRLEKLQDVIQQHVMDVLTRCGGNKLRAAELLGISRSTLYRMLDTVSVSGHPLAE